MENVTTVASQVIQPNSAQNQRSLTMTVIIVGRRVVKQQTVEPQRAQGKEDRRERVMEFMNLQYMFSNTWKRTRVQWVQNPLATRSTSEERLRQS